MGRGQPQQVDRKVAGVGGLFFIALTIGLGFFAFWSLAAIHGQYSAWLETNAVVLIEDTGITIFYGSALLLAALFIFGVYGVWIGVVGRRSATFDRRWMKPLSSLILVGFVCLFIGRYAGNALWSESFQSYGYTQCPGTFVLTGKWAVRVWSSEPSICFDEELKNKLRSPAYSISELNTEYRRFFN